jgi:hypothetical protein
MTLKSIRNLQCHGFNPFGPHLHTRCLFVCTSCIPMAPYRHPDPADKIWGVSCVWLLCFLFVHRPTFPIGLPTSCVPATVAALPFSFIDCTLCSCPYRFVSLSHTQVDSIMVKVIKAKEDYKIPEGGTSSPSVHVGVHVSGRWSISERLHLPVCVGRGDREKDETWMWWVAPSVLRI